METENKKISFEFNNLLILYRHYKDYLLPVGIILASIAILFLIIIPQFQQYFISSRQLNDEIQKLQVLKNNYNFLLNLDDSQSNSDFKTLSFVLPSDKDFAGIVNAISYASAKTGVLVGDFEFSVGNLSGTTQGGVSASPSIKIDVNLTGDFKSMIQYIAELYKTAPASEVTDIKIGGDSGNITVFFYYKPLLSQNVDDTAPIVSLSDSNLALIKTVSSWNNAQAQSVLPLLPTVLSSSPATAGASVIRSGSSPF